MPDSTRDLEDYFELSARIFSDYRDPRRGPFSLVYLYSETSDNADSCFLRAIELVRGEGVKAVGTAEGALGHGYDGFEASCKRLRALGWSDESPIQKILVDGVVNTLSEAQALVNRMKSVEGDVGIVAPPFHIVRAFVTTITALKESGQERRIYALPGTPLEWGERVRHSQGELIGTRSELLQSELSRLQKYRTPEFGNLLSPREVLEYLNWRDP
jgi:hypothetical protein